MKPAEASAGVEWPVAADQVAVNLLAQVLEEALAVAEQSPHQEEAVPWEWENQSLTTIKEQTKPPTFNCS